MLFTIRLVNGDEVHAAEGDELSVNDDTGVISVSRLEGFEQVTTRERSAVCCCIEASRAV